MRTPTKRCSPCGSLAATTHCCAHAATPCRGQRVAVVPAFDLIAVPTGTPATLPMDAGTVSRNSNLTSGATHDYGAGASPWPAWCCASGSRDCLWPTSFNTGRSLHCRSGSRGRRPRSTGKTRRLHSFRRSRAWRQRRLERVPSSAADLCANRLSALGVDSGVPDLDLPERGSRLRLRLQGPRTSGPAFRGHATPRPRAPNPSRRRA